MWLIFLIWYHEDNYVRYIKWYFPKHIFQSFLPPFEKLIKTCWVFCLFLLVEAEICFSIPETICIAQHFHRFKITYEERSSYYLLLTINPLERIPIWPCKFSQFDLQFWSYTIHSICFIRIKILTSLIGQQLVRF